MKKHFFKSLSVRLPLLFVAGMDAHLSKPVDIDQLKEVLGALLVKRQENHS